VGGVPAWVKKNVAVFRAVHPLVWYVKHWAVYVGAGYLAPPTITQWATPAHVAGYSRRTRRTRQRESSSNRWYKLYYLLPPNMGYTCPRGRLLAQNTSHAAKGIVFEQVTDIMATPQEGNAHKWQRHRKATLTNGNANFCPQNNATWRRKNILQKRWVISLLKTKWSKHSSYGMKLLIP
jgi:hypothetical protein